MLVATVNRRTLRMNNTNWTEYPRIARPAIRRGLLARSRHANDQAVHPTEAQNQSAPRVSASSSRSPTVETARSGLVTNDSTHSARCALRMSDSRKFQAGQQSLVGTLRASDRPHAFGSDREETLGPPAALRRWFAKPRRDQAFVLEPVERRVQRAGTHHTARAVRNLIPERHRIRAVVQAEDRKQDDLLEQRPGHVAVWR